MSEIEPQVVYVSVPYATYNKDHGGEPYVKKSYADKLRRQADQYLMLIQKKSERIEKLRAALYCNAVHSPGHCRICDTLAQDDTLKEGE